MAERRDRSSFPAEPSHRLRIRSQAHPHELDGDVAAQQPIQGRIHVRHATLAEKRDELITAGEQLIALLTHDGTIHEQTI